MCLLTTRGHEPAFYAAIPVGLVPRFARGGAYWASWVPLGEVQHLHACRRS